METIIEGTWRGKWGARLHVAPEGMTLVDDGGVIVGNVGYDEVRTVNALKHGRRASLCIDAGHVGPQGTWELGGLHPLQARFGTELIQEQLAAMKRSTLPAFAEKQSLAQMNNQAATLLSSSSRGVVEVLDYVLAQAVLHGASDIHIEPYPKTLNIRFRIDGMLADVLQVSQLWQPRLLARIKVLADLAVYRTDVPQEGRIQVRVGEQRVDVRVSLLPTLHGEKAVLRIFDPERRIVSLHRLGMFPDVMASWERLMEQPQGLLLVTGPSNHGKTTTLYASINRIHSTRKDLSNLCTVEDPIENDLQIISQTQVNQAAGLTFANGLRTVLRQDPEVIMLGEIRDQETAEVALRAGLTGHLILSTVHARSAAGVFARLVELGCPPYMVAGTVTGILAQRLVRRICEDCKKPEKPTAGQIQLLTLASGDRVEGEWMHGVGCEKCGGSGYRGRIGVFHLLEPHDALRAAVVAGKTAGELEQVSQSEAGLLASALRWASVGTTSLDEVERVLGRAAR